MNTSFGRYFGGFAAAAVVVLLGFGYPLTRGPVDVGVAISAMVVVTCGLVIAYDGVRALLDQRGESAMADAPSAETVSDR